MQLGQLHRVVLLLPNQAHPIVLFLLRLACRTQYHLAETSNQPLPIEVALDIPSGNLQHSREVLRDYGNMSAATVMFVLEAGLRSPRTGYTLLSSFGPGFTAGFVLLQAL